MASTRLWGLVSAHRTSIRFVSDMVQNILPKENLRFTGIDPSTIGNMLGRSPKLQHIDMSDTSVVDDKVCFHIGTSCPRLRTLSLRGSPQITDIGLEDIAMCRVLQRLDLSFCHLISDEGLAVLARNMPELELLALAHCADVSEEGVQVCSCLITVIMFTLCREACSRCFARLACAITNTRANCFADLGRVQRDTVHGYQVHDVSCLPRLHEPTISQTSPRAL